MNAMVDMVKVEYHNRLDVFFANVLNVPFVKKELIGLYDRKVFFKQWSGFGGMEKAERQEILQEASKYTEGNENRIELSKIIYVILKSI